MLINTFQLPFLSIYFHLKFQNSKQAFRFNNTCPKYLTSYNNLITDIFNHI